ncbi:HK97 family phage prohead protease [Kitasatospora sp. NPDC057500]|uniref:HK97 family phage prohead protease n=1 Tax=Kitasatospora sp. NPDC057500 TaxID=3346151 RepID=UPI0036983501
MPDITDRARPAGIERRAWRVDLEVRTAPDSDGTGPVTVEGYASVVNQPFQMWDWAGEYNEVVRRGAFGKTLAETPQVQLLLNHGGLAMAYTKAGTLRLSEDSTGLHMAATVNPARGDVRDMLAALEDGDVDEMSFAFRVTRQQWSPDWAQRDILEVDLHRGDVSVVNFGANPATSVSLRGLDLPALDRLAEDDARALYERLGARLAAPAPAAGAPLGLYLAQAEALAL